MGAGWQRTPRVQSNPRWHDAEDVSIRWARSIDVGKDARVSGTSGVRCHAPANETSMPRTCARSTRADAFNTSVRQLLRA